MVWRWGQTHPEDPRARVPVAADGGGVAPLFEVDVPYVCNAITRRRLTGIAGKRISRQQAQRPPRCPDRPGGRTSRYYSHRVVEGRAWRRCASRPCGRRWRRAGSGLKEDLPRRRTDARGCCGYHAAVNARQRRPISCGAVDRTVNVKFSTPISAKCGLEAQSGDTIVRDNHLKLRDRLCSAGPKPDRQAPLQFVWNFRCLANQISPLSPEITFVLLQVSS